MTSINQLSSDISRCSGVGCPLKSKCLRYLSQFTDEDNELLWYIDPGYRDGECKNLINKEHNNGDKSM